MIKTVQIRTATVADAAGILAIYHYWKDLTIDDDAAKRYYVLKNEFTLEQVEKICADGFATVAVNGTLVVSFYFLNPYFDTGNLTERQQVIADLICEGRIPEGKYALSLLSSTHADYQGQGLNNQTLHLLRANLAEDYDYFAGVMNYSNTGTHKSSLKMGWKHYGDIGIGILALIGTTAEKDSLLNFNL